MKKTLNKLVRNNLPEIIKENGKVCNYKILNDYDYKESLIKKLLEEIEKFKETKSEEEIADIYEILSCIVKIENFEPLHIDYLRIKKRETRGSFDKKIFLIDIEE